MKKLSIEYRYLWFWHKKKSIDVPQTWEDLSQKQFEVCAQQYIEPLEDKQFVSRFFGLNKRLVSKFSQYEVYKLSELATFAMTANGNVNRFFMERIPNTALLSPQERLVNVSFEHFALFDTYFFRYAYSKKDSDLSMFIATLYLKKGEKVTTIDIEKRQKYIEKRIDKATQYAIFLNYTFVREWLSTRFRFLFDKQDPDENSTKKSNPKNKQQGPDWNQVLDGLVGDDILHYQDYKLMPCIVAFKTINKRLKEYARNGK